MSETLGNASTPISGGSTGRAIKPVLGKAAAIASPSPAGDTPGLSQFSNPGEFAVSNTDNIFTEFGKTANAAPGWPSTTALNPYQLQMISDFATQQAINQQIAAAQKTNEEDPKKDKKSKTKVTGEEATVENAKKELAGLSVTETSGVASLGGNTKASMAAGAALESGQDLNKENVIDSLAQMFGGNEDILDFIKDGSVNIGDTVGGQTRFGGGAGAMATVGSIAMGRNTFGKGMLAHEAAHAFLDPAIDGTLDGKTGNEKIDNLMIEAEKKVRSSDYNLSGLQNLHYGMAAENPDDAERLAVLFENYVANNESFKEHFPELAEAFDEHLSKDMDKEQIVEETQTQAQTPLQPLVLINPMQALILGRQLMGIRPGPIFPQAFAMNTAFIGPQSF